LRCFQLIQKHLIIYGLLSTVIPLGPMLCVVAPSRLGDEIKHPSKTSRLIKGSMEDSFTEIMTMVDVFLAYPERRCLASTPDLWFQMSQGFRLYGKFLSEGGLRRLVPRFCKRSYFYETHPRFWKRGYFFGNAATFLEIGPRFWKRGYFLEKRSRFWKRGYGFGNGSTFLQTRLLVGLCHVFGNAATWISLL
jgi:hypothetical protein